MGQGVWRLPRRARANIGRNQALAAAKIEKEQPYDLADLYYPVARLSRDQPVRPTWIGDRIHTVTATLHTRYGLDLATVSQALSLTMPAEASAAIDDARLAYRRASVLAAWALLYLAVGIASWPALGIAVVSAGPLSIAPGWLSKAIAFLWKPPWRYIHLIFCGPWGSPIRASSTAALVVRLLVIYKGDQKMRDQLIQFIYARLARYSQWQDASDILDEDLRTKAFELLELVGQQAVDLQAVAAVACVFWLRSRLLPEGQDEADRQIAVDLYRIIHQVSPQAVPPELRSAVREEGPAGRAVRVDPKMAYRVLLINLNAALGVGDATKVSTCINVLQRLLDAMPADHTDRPEIMAILAAGHGGLYQITNDPADLDAEISILQSCTHDSGRTDSDFASQLQLLGDALEQRFRRAGAPADLDAAIRARRRTLALTAAGDPDRETRAYRLGTLLLTRAGRVGHLNDLDEGIEALQAACTTRDKGPDRCPWLYELGNGLLERYNRKYQPADLDAAITAYTDALSATDTSSPLYALYAVHAAHALQQRFNLRDDLTDCDAAIRTLRRALSEQATAQLPDDLRATQLGALGVALHERYLAVGDINDIHAAADGFRAAASSVHVSNQFQARMLIGLGVAVSLLHLHSGDESYWAESLEVYTAVAKSPAAGPNLRDQAAAGCAGLHRRRNDPAVPGPVVRSQELAAAIERLRGKGRTEQGLDELNQTIVYTQRLLSLSEPGDPASVRHMVLLGEDLLNDIIGPVGSVMPTRLCVLRC